MTRDSTSFATRSAASSALLLALIATAGCSRTFGGTAAESPPAPPATASLRRGDFQQRLLLTGELRATHSTPIVVPKTQNWNLAVRWLIEDGTRVSAGDRLIELDNSSLVSSLEDLREASIRAANELTKAGFETRRRAAELELEVERRRVEMEKARMAAEIPMGLVSRREHETRLLLLARSQSEHEKAVEELGAIRDSARAELSILRVQVEKAQREVTQAERDLGALTMVSPVAGVVLVADHPWYPRKLRVGDRAWPGLVVLTLPDLESMEIVAHLSDVDSGKIRSGMGGTCRLDTYPERPVQCSVAGVAPVARESGRDSLRRSFEVLIELEQTDEERMRPGMSAEVEVVTLHFEEALLVARAEIDLTVDPPRRRLPDGSSEELRLGPCSAFDCIVLEEENGRAHQADEEGKEAGREEGGAVSGTIAEPTAEEAAAGRRRRIEGVEAAAHDWARAWLTVELVGGDRAVASFVQSSDPANRSTAWP